MNDRSRDNYRDDAFRGSEAELEAYEYEEEDSGVRMPLFVILALVVVAAIIGVGFVAYQKGYDDRATTIANQQFIAANGGASRERPAEPGGLAAPQDRDVFRELDGRAQDGAEQIVSREEPIVDIPASRTQAPAPSAQTAQAPASQPNLRGTPTAQTGRTPAEPQTPAQAAPTPAQTVPQPVEAARLPDTQDDRILVPPPSSRLRDAATQAGQSVTGAANQAAQQAQQARQAVSQAASQARDTIGPQPAAPVAAAANAASGRFVVQLASLPSRAAADQTWSRVFSRYSGLLSGYTKDIQTADLGARGVYHRLRIGYFPTRDAANRLCQSLKAQGQDCLVQTR